MCGICGIYNFRTGEAAHHELVNLMAADMTHRGPDDDGFFFEGPLGLGMRRLSIIDINHGAQPISNEGGTVNVVCNGEIYNFQDLRCELESFGHSFKTNSDVESIVHGYEQWGFDVLSKLNGMFGLAIWDSSNRTLLLARDPFGVKPLYYWTDGQTFTFASEIRPLFRHPLVKNELAVSALDEYVALGFTPAPKTLFQGINKILPGHALVIGSQGVQNKRFYRVLPDLLTDRSEDEIVEELRVLIKKAVLRQTVADVPVGAMLSGGVDSSTVSKLMSEATSQPVQTFTVGFSGDFALNEVNYANEWATKIGSNQRDTLISSDDFLDFLPSSVWSLEEPLATDSTFAFHRVCALASQHVKVVLTGQGADEPFAGYPRHFGEYYGAYYRKIPKVIREQLVARLVKALPRNERAKRAVDSLGLEDTPERFKAVYAILSREKRKSLFQPGVVQNGPENSFSIWQQDVRDLDGLSQMLYVDARFSLADNLLMYGDKMAMACSLEARVPFLDLDLMKFVESIPARYKIKGRTQKHILRKAVSEWIPDDILSRPKIPFRTPVDTWFRQDMHGYLEERLLDSASGCRKYFDPKALRGMIMDHKTGRQDYKRSLFGLLVFEIWHDQFIRPTKTQLAGYSKTG